MVSEQTWESVAKARLDDDDDDSVGINKNSEVI